MNIQMQVSGSMKFLSREVRLMTCACLLVSALSAVQGAYAQAERIGYVVDVEGRWLLNGQRLLTKGQALPPGGVIYPQSPTELDYIVVSTLSGNTLRRSCNRTGDCGSPLKLPRNVRSQPGFWETILDSGMRLLWGEEDKFSIHRSRGGDADLQDAVVPLTSGHVDLSPIFEGKEKGLYYVRLRAVPLRKGQQAKEQFGPVSIDWHGTALPALALRGLGPGLYSVTLTDERGEKDSSQEGNAWLLITKEKNYPALAASYSQAKALTKKWGGDVSPEAAGSFLRAYLNHLALAQLK